MSGGKCSCSSRHAGPAGDIVALFLCMTDCELVSDVTHARPAVFCANRSPAYYLKTNAGELRGVGMAN